MTELGIHAVPGEWDSRRFAHADFAMGDHTCGWGGGGHAHLPKHGAGGFDSGSENVIVSAENQAKLQAPYVMFCGTIRMVHHIEFVYRAYRLPVNVVQFRSVRARKSRSSARFDHDAQ